MKSHFTALLIVGVLALLLTGTTRAQQSDLVVQTGHTSTIYCVAFSPDGRLLASGGGDNTIKLWEVATGRELRTLTGHTSVVSSLTFSRDGKLLVSAGRDATIRLWNLVTRDVRILTGHSSGINSLTLSSDGSTLASGSNDKTIRLWDTNNGSQKRTFIEPDEIQSVMLFADGKILISGSTSHIIKLRDTNTGDELRILSSTPGKPMDVLSTYLRTQLLALNADGQIFAAITDRDTIKVWETATWRELHTLTAPTEVLGSIALSPDGHTLASGTQIQAGNLSSYSSERIQLWDLSDGRRVRALRSTGDCFAFSPDGQTLAGSALVGNKMSIGLWEARTGGEKRMLTAHSDSVSLVMFGLDGQTLVILTGGAIKLWEPTTGRELQTIRGNLNTIDSLALSPDGKALAVNSDVGPIKLWELTTGKVLRTLDYTPMLGRAMAFSPDGKHLAVGQFTNTISLLDLTTGGLVRTFTGHVRDFSSVAFSADGQTLIGSGKVDVKNWQDALSWQTVNLWEVKSGKELGTIRAKGHPIVMNADGKSFAAPWGNEIRMFDLAGRELRKFVGHSTKVSSIAISKDGRILAGGSEDGTIRLWELDSGRELGTLTGHSSAVNSLAFNPDGALLVSGSSDATTRLWRVKSKEAMVSLISLDGKDWAVVSSSGLFDVSPGARKSMHYVVGTEVVTLDQMKDLYYVPGLLQKSVAGAVLPKVGLFGAGDLFPEARYEPLKPGQRTLTVKLRNRGGGIGPVQVLVNGTEVIADGRPAGFDPRTNEATLTINLAHVKQLVPGQENKVEVITRNAAGSLTSKNSARGGTVTMIGAGKKLTEPPQLYAIVGGVATYVGGGLQLQYSAKDAKDFARALEIGASKFLGADKVHMRLLTSDSGEAEALLSGPDSSVLLPTKENFRKVFAEFASKAKPNDMLVVFLSGHGVALNLNRDPNKPGGDAYLYLTAEAYTTEPSALADEKVRTATSVSGEELVGWIKGIAALSKALVLDTCAAGAAVESLIARKAEPTDAIKIRALDRLRDTTGFFILMGSAGDKQSYEATPYRQGLLTYSLLEALKGAKLHNGGYANVGQLFGYAQERVPAIAQTLGLSQQPRFLAPDVGSPFDVGLYTADEQKLFALPARNPLILRPSLQNKDLGYDNLKLVPVLQRALLDASHVSKRGGNEASLLVFVDASEMLDAFTPAGSYTVAGNKVTVNLNLVRNDKPVATVTVEGTVTDELSKTTLVQRLIAALSTEARKSISPAQ